MKNSMHTEYFSSKVQKFMKIQTFVEGFWPSTDNIYES